MAMTFMRCSNVFRTIAKVLGLLLGLSLPVLADIGGPIMGRFISNKSTSTLEEFTVYKGTVTRQFFSLGDTYTSTVTIRTGGIRFPNNSFQTTAATGGGGASSLEMFSGAARSSPTASVNAYAHDFNGTVIGSTFTLALNPSTTDFIHNQATLQSGATSYPDYEYVNSSFTSLGPVRVYGALDVGGDGTGFGFPSKMTFDPSFSASAALILKTNNFIGTSPGIFFTKYDDSSYGSILGGFGSQIGIPDPGGLSVLYGITGGTLTVTNLTTSSTTINGVAMSWPSSGTVGNYLQYTSPNKLQWVPVSASGISLTSTQTWSGTQTFSANIILSSAANAFFSNASDYQGVGLPRIQNTAGSGTNNILTIASGGGIVLESSVTVQSTATFKGALILQSSVTVYGASAFLGPIQSTATYTGALIERSSLTVYGTSLLLGPVASTTTFTAPVTFQGSVTASGLTYQVILCSSTALFTTTSTSFVNVSTCTITPTKTSSKIKITATGELTSGGGNASTFATLTNGSTNLAGANGLASTTSIGGLGTEGTSSMLWVDSPNSTSAQAYHVYIRTSNGSLVARYNDNTETSTIILEEIGQ